MLVVSDGKKTVLIGLFIIFASDYLPILQSRLKKNLKVVTL